MCKVFMAQKKPFMCWFTLIIYSLPYSLSVIIVAYLK